MADYVCTINSVTVTPPGAGGRDNVGLSTALIQAACSASLPEAHAEESSSSTSLTSWIAGGSVASGQEWEERVHTTTETRIWVSYQDLVYNWTPVPSGDYLANGGASPTLHYTGLSEKSENSIAATVEVTCTTIKQPQQRTKTTTYTWWQNYDSDGNPTTSGSNTRESAWSAWGNSGSPTTITPSCANTATSSYISIWTQPNMFTDFDGFTAEDIIHDNLTAGKVAAWIAHANYMNHWFTQSSADANAGACSVNSEDIITATWYNSCATVCNTYTEATGVTVSTVEGGPSGTIIIPAQFNGGSGLAKGISKATEV